MGLLNKKSLQYFVTSELSAYSQLMEPGVIQLLKKQKFSLCLCVHADQLNEQLHALCDLYEQAGVQIIFWPLLSLEKGLYLNKYSIKSYEQRLDEIFTWLAERKHHLYGLLVDCEPDYQKPDPHSKSPFLDSVLHNLRDLDEEAFQAAINGFNKIITKIREHDCKAIGAALPFVCNDKLESTDAWQDYWGGPVACVDWDSMAFMLFGSWFVQMGMNWATAHRLIYDYTRVVNKFWRKETVVALGVTAAGTGAETAIYPSPEELSAGASVVKAAGINNIGIYDLKGILDSPTPEQWLLKVRKAPPLVPDGRSLPESKSIVHWKIILYKVLAAAVGKILELIQFTKSLGKLTAGIFTNSKRNLKR